MKKKEITDIIQKRMEKISKQCEDINSGFDADAIHKFRVSVKKLRSILRLLKAQDENAPGLTKKFKNLYEIAGHIRDNELAIGKISGAHLVMPEYLQQLHDNVAHYKNEWKRHYSKKVLQKMERKLIDYEFNDLQPPVLGDFLQKSFENLQHISNATLPPNNDIHSIRKIMKDMLYLSAFTENKWDDAHKYVKAIPVKSLGELTDIIGRFNDERLSLGKMTDFARQRVSPGEKNRIENLCNEEAALLLEQKKYIVSATKDFLDETHKAAIPAP